MPNRILREGILTSVRVSSLGWAEEVFYRRLMSIVDDFGRYYATPMLLRAACYPLHLDKVSDSDIEKWLTKCVDAALVRVYPAQDGKRYLQMMDFRQQVRAKESKFPAMDSERVADAMHVRCGCKSSAHLDVDVVEGVDDYSPASGDSAESSIPPCPTSKIVDLFKAKCPSLITPRIVPDAVKQNISARWRQDEKHRSLEFWERFFEHCEKNDFLAGRTNGRDGAKPFRAGLEWIVKSSNFAKIVNGNYDT